MRIPKFLMAALGLLTSALTAQAAPPSNITISSVPFSITAPGTYVLAGDLTLPSSAPSGSAAIYIPSTVAGTVLLDFKGHTLTGPGPNYYAILIDGQNKPPNSFPITIRNGTVTNFAFGVGAYGDTVNGNLSAITINALVFSINSSTGVGYGVIMRNTGASVVSGCRFSGAVYGIFDFISGGNSYSNDTFAHDVQTDLYVGNGGGATPNGLSLDRCSFSPVVK